MPYPCSLLIAHKNTKLERIACAVGRGHIVSKTIAIAIIKSAIVLWVLLGQVGLLIAAPNETRMAQFDIPRQSADDSLPAFGQQANITVVYPFEDASKHITNRLHGEYTLKEGIYILLKDSGLSAEFSVDGHLIISSDNVYGESMMRSKKNILAAIVGFFIAGSAQQGVTQEERHEEEWLLEEVVITATRRAVGLSDTAISVSAVGNEEISRRNLTEMNDYLRTMPGVNLMDRGVSQNAVVVRGLAMDVEGEGFASSPTTGVYFGEVPLGGLGVFGGSSDLKMIDLDRVEVLRGPQGTLFGSSALAGAVRNIPVSPSMQEFQGYIKSSYSNTAEEGGDNTKFEGVINVPVVEDTLAIRAVAYRHDTSGYIKNIAGTQLATNGLISSSTRAADAVASFGGSELYQNKDDVGNAVHTGGRIAALWTPNDQLSITLQYIGQDVEQVGQPFVQLKLGTYEQVAMQFGVRVPALIDKEEGLQDDIGITNLVAEYDFGWATLMSSTAWLEQDGERVDDVSYFLGGMPLVRLYESSADAFTEDLRLVSQLDGPFQYIAGIYYEDNDVFTDSSNYLTGDLDMMPGWILNPADNSDPQITTEFFDRTLEQLAFYGELSYELTDQLTLTGGFRHFDYERSFKYFLEGSLGASDDPVNTLEETGNTYKANLSYEPNDNTLIYAQWAEGFRLGNAISPPPPALCDVNNDGILDGTDSEITPFFESDNTENIELGAKFTLLDNRLQVNSAIYQIDWDGIPLTVIGGQLPSQPVQTCFSAITKNAGEARSQGFEIEVTYQINQHFNVNFGGAYNDAELTKVDADVSASFSEGDRLPSAPETSVNLGLQYEFQLSGYDAYLRGDYAYVSEFFTVSGEKGGFQGEGAGDYGQVNMSAGIALDKLTLEVFANNLTNDDGITHLGFITLRDDAYRLRPRTMGFNLSYHF